MFNVHEFQISTVPPIFHHPPTFRKCSTWINMYLKTFDMNTVNHFLFIKVYQENVKLPKNAKNLLISVLYMLVTQKFH